MKSACTSLFMKIQIPRAVKRNTFLTQLQFFFCLPYLECLCVYTRIHKKLHYDKMLFPFFAINTNCSCNFCTIMSYFYQKHLGKQNDIFFYLFWFIGNLTYLAKACWNTPRYNFIAIAIAKSNFNLKFKSIFIYSFKTPLFGFQSKKSIASSKLFSCMKKIIFRLINPDCKIKRKEFRISKCVLIQI